MTPLTDLTFNQLAAEYEGAGDVFFVGQDSNADITVLISVGALLEQPIENLDDVGIVKLTTKLLNLCRKAQATANTSQAEGEKLNAFLPPVSAGMIQDGYVEVSETIKSRIVISSASQILGSTD